MAGVESTLKLRRTANRAAGQIVPFGYLRRRANRAFWSLAPSIESRHLVTCAVGQIAPFGHLRRRANRAFWSAFPRGDPIMMSQSGRWWTAWRARIEKRMRIEKLNREANEDREAA